MQLKRHGFCTVSLFSIDLDFRQILKGFTDMRHHLNRVEQKLDAISSGNTAVAELAEVQIIHTVSATFPLKQTLSLAESGGRQGDRGCPR